MMFWIPPRVVTRHYVVRPLIAGLRVSHRCHRRFSLISIHSSFPASLFRLEQQPKSGLFDYSKSQTDVSPEDGVLISDDGLVYPRLSVKLPCPSAL